MAKATPESHELVRVFEQHGFALNATLTEMLNEHYTHHTERRGCGYTQATRHIAEYINRPRDRYLLDDLTLFREESSERLQNLLEALNKRTAQAVSWRHLDRQMNALKSLLTDRGDARLRCDLRDEAQRQAQLRRMVKGLQREESRILAELITAIILPHDSLSGLITLHSYPEQLSIGTCTLAEKYFLELAHRHIKRGALMNVIVSNDGQPLLLEKVNLGDTHSCISLVPLLLNGICLPAGSLLGVAYDDAVRGERHTDPLPGYRLVAAHCEGFRFLRLTTLAVTPANRARAFTVHFAAQRDQGFFGPETASIGQLEKVARLAVRNSVERKGIPALNRSKSRVYQDLLKQNYVW